MVKKTSSGVMGRPRKPQDEVRKPLVIRLSDKDRECLRGLAEGEGLSLATYIVAVLRRHVDEKR